MEHYGYIFESLPSLTPDQRARLADLLLEYESLRFDIRASAAEQGITIGTDAYNKASDRVLAEFNAKMEALCESCPSIREFLPLGKLNVQRIDLQYGAPLAYAGEPLTLQQRLGLARVARGLPVSPGPISVEALRRGELPQFDAFLAQAAPYLSERQIAVLRARRGVEIAQYLRAASRIGRPRE